jgi:hypothetical protein
VRRALLLAFLASCPEVNSGPGGLTLKQVDKFSGTCLNSLFYFNIFFYSPSTPPSSAGSMGFFPLPAQFDLWPDAVISYQGRARAGGGGFDPGGSRPKYQSRICKMGSSHPAGELSIKTVHIRIVV